MKFVVSQYAVEIPPYSAIVSLQQAYFDMLAREEEDGTDRSAGSMVFGVLTSEEGVPMLHGASRAWGFFQPLRPATEEEITILKAFCVLIDLAQKQRLKG